MRLSLKKALCGGATVLLLGSSTDAATVGLGFQGVININGAFPLNPDPVGQPTSGTLLFNNAVATTGTTASSASYSDPTGVLRMDFGVAGAFNSFTSNTPLALSVQDSGANTVFRVEAWNGGSPGMGNKGIILFTLPGLNAFGANHALPTAAFGTGDIVSGGGSITIGGGLTSFAVTGVTPEPASLLALAGLFGVVRRHRRAEADSSATRRHACAGAC